MEWVAVPLHEYWRNCGIHSVKWRIKGHKIDCLTIIEDIFTRQLLLTLVRIYDVVLSVVKYCKKQEILIIAIIKICI